MRSGNSEPRQFEQRIFEQKIAEPRVRLPQIAEPAPPEPVLAPHRTDTPKLTAPAPPCEAEPVRRVNPLRIRSRSILGLDYSRHEPPSPDPDQTIPE
jgi:hypothetical protein